MSEQTAWVIVFDDLQEHVIWAENIGDVFSFIDFNQTALFGHESIGHINIQIDKLSEREIDERFSKKGSVFEEGFWTPSPGETIPDEVRTEGVDDEPSLYEKLATQSLEFTTDPVDLDLEVVFGPQARHITW